MSSLIGRLLVGLLCLVSLAGCGSKTVVLEGRLTADGKPLEWKEDAPLEVQLSNATANVAFSAPVETGGKFTVKGGDGRGIPPGNYTFAVRTISTGPRNKIPSPLLDGIESIGNSPLKYEVTTDGKQHIVIDVTKHTIQRE